MSLEDVDEITLERMREDLWIPVDDPRMDINVGIDCFEEAAKYLDSFSFRDQLLIKTIIKMAKEIDNDH